MVSKAAAFFFALGAAFGQTPANGQPAGIEGVVVNSATGQLVPRVHVMLVGSSENAPRQYGAMTTAEGRFSIAGISAGPYVATAERVGFVAPSGTPALMLPPGESKTDVKLVIVPTGAVTGQVTDSEGAPVEGATVSAERQGLTIATAGTDDKGEYRIGGLAPGKYRIRVTHENWMRLGPETRTDGTEEINYAATYYPGSADAKAAGRVEVRAAVEASGIDVRLARYPIVRVSGRVTGIPAGLHVQVSAQTETGLDGGSATVRPDGSFEIWRLDPGTYSLTAVWSSPEGRNFQSARLPIEVTGADIGGLELQIVPPSNIPGRLEFDDDKAKKQPMPTRTLLLREVDTLNPMSFSARVESGDTFVLIDVQPGRYRVELPLTGVYVKSMRLGSAAIDGAVLDLSHGANGIDLSVLLSSDTGSVSGTVHDDSGSAAGTRVVLRAEPGNNEKGYVTAGADGSYSFAGLAPGSYKIVAVQESDNDAVTQQFGLESYDGLMDEIEIHAGLNVTRVLRRLTPR